MAWRANIIVSGKVIIVNTPGLKKENTPGLSVNTPLRWRCQIRQLQVTDRMRPCRRYSDQQTDFACAIHAFSLVSNKQPLATSATVLGCTREPRSWCRADEWCPRDRSRPDASTVHGIPPFCSSTTANTFSCIGCCVHLGSSTCRCTGRMPGCFLAQ